MKEMKEKFNQIVPVYITPRTRSKIDIHYKW